MVSAAEPGGAILAGSFGGGGETRMRRFTKRAVIAVAVVVALAAVGFAYYRHRYPHGWSHCCDKQLMMALLEYADRHDGWFPKGEATPQASLSLLHRENPELVTANLLRGKTIAVRAPR